MRVAAASALWPSAERQLAKCSYRKKRKNMHCLWPQLVAASAIALKDPQEPQAQPGAMTPAHAGTVAVAASALWPSAEQQHTKFRIQKRAAVAQAAATTGRCVRHGS